MSGSLFRDNPIYHHGFSGEVPAFKLVDQLNIDQRHDALLERLGVDEAGFAELRANPPSLIYSGRQLDLAACGSDLALGARHISELWTMPYLLGLYSGPDADWFSLALQSLQESDPKAALRPLHVAHPNLIARLRTGTDTRRWILNAIRLRVTDRTTDSNAENIPTDTGSPIMTEASPSAPVVAQIKLNYELDVYGAGTDRIDFFSMIHSIAIDPRYLDDFIIDVLRISQDPALSGCDLLALLNKYVRNSGLTAYDPPRSGYFFLHTNVLDNALPIPEWRFAELKPVDNDHIPFSERGQFDASARAASRRTIVRDLVAEHLAAPAGTELPTPDFAGIARAIAFGSNSISRKIYRPIEMPVGRNDPQIALRIVPLSFPIFVTRSPFSDEIRLATNLEPVSVWYSGSQIDEGRNLLRGARRINLLVDINGNEVPVQHPGRRHEETWTCAQCHMRQVVNRLEAVPGVQGGLLEVVPFHNFRHIGFGDGGINNCNGMFGSPRPGRQPLLSEFLLDVANGTNINRVTTDLSKRIQLGIQNPNLTPGAGVDYLRCQTGRGI